MLPKAYDPKVVEDRIYQMWEESGAFKADAKSHKEPFTISMPPPNATGQLHLGHAVMLALEDIFTRFARMQGKEVLWLPGTDHAAIATESVVIKKIQKEERIADPRAKLGREGLVARIAQFVEESRGTIRSQVRKMGSSCDWTRERYTMDPALNRSVNEVFKLMYDDALIYRGKRVVNWDTALQTTLADDEIEYKDVEATLYTFEYLSAEQTGGEPVYVSSSRPETKLGDTALVVHPEDERYRHLVGKTFSVTWPRGQQITVTVVADHTVDPAFGTGVLGLTPFHSKIDEELAKRHSKTIVAEPISVIGEDGRIVASIAGYAGMTVEEARTAFVEDLRAAGRIKEEKKYMQPLPHSYRSKKPVEALPKLQWFIDVQKPAFDWKGKKASIKEVMQDVVRAEMIRIIPDRFEKTYFQWVDNLQDWCISRQIWWGHRIPVWYRGGDIAVSNAQPAGEGWVQDTDTLDTWFSSALWTWSTLIDPALAEDESLSLVDMLQQSPDFQKFHPTDVLETAADILFFWVARMILMTTYALGKVPGLPEEKRIPFRTVYLHGLVLDRNGQKMSKSHPETAIDPLIMIPQYGADALRLSMIVGQSPGNSFSLYEEKIAGYRNFINKLWNASRFVLMQCEQTGVDPHSVDGFDPKSLADQALVHELDQVIADVTKSIEQFRLSDSGERLYSFVWEFFCDWYLELSKGESNPQLLVHALRTILQLLHPYCPFVTEELWEQVRRPTDPLLIAMTWPEAGTSSFGDAHKQLSAVIEVVKAIRKLRTEQDVEPGKEVSITLVSAKHAALLQSQQAHIARLGKAALTISATAQAVDNVASAFISDIEVHLSLEGLVDVEKEKKSLQAERENIQQYLKGIEAKLGNENFVARAKPEVVEAEKEKRRVGAEKLQKIEERLRILN